MPPIEVKPSATYWIVLAVLVWWFGSMGLMAVVLALSQVSTHPAKALGLVLLAPIGLVPLLWTGGRRGWAKRLDVAGVTRADGRVFPWSAFVCVESNRGRGGVVSYDLVFEDAKVRLPMAFGAPQTEIQTLAERLAAGQNPFVP